MADDTTTDKLTPAQHRAVLALLNEPTVRKAAEVAEVKERTLFHWLRTSPMFIDEYRSARREATRQAIGRLQQYSGAAAGTLVQLMAAGNPAVVRLGAARAVLEFAIKAVELEDLEARLKQLEERYAQS